MGLIKWGKKHRNQLICDMIIDKRCNYFTFNLNLIRDVYTSYTTYGD